MLEVKNLHNRIKLVRKANKLTQPEFGEVLGVSRDVVANIELGRVEPKPLMLNHIVAVFGVSKTWLETGDGEMYPPKTRDEAIVEWAARITREDNKNEFANQVAGALAMLDDTEWVVLEKFVRNIIENKKK